jgi:membrane-bound ClpP family serine protease
MIRVHGELWRAVCSIPVDAGQTVTVRDREGLTLQVEPQAQEAPSSSSSV